MRTRNVLYLMVFLASASLARGQSAGVGEVLPAPTEKLDLLQEKSIVAEDAETAEAMEAFQRRSRLWFRGEFLLWFIKPANLPPLVTQGPFTDPRPGTLDSLETQILFGQSGMDFQDRTGGRFTFGYWLDDDHALGVNASYFFLRGRAIGHAFDSAGEPVLAMPFFNANTGLQDSSLITFPGVMSGQVVVDAPSFLQGADANLTANLWGNDWLRWDASLGFRYLNLIEGLNIKADSLVQLAPQFQGFGIPFDGNTITIEDSFETRNHFYGGQLGTSVELTRGRWGVDILGKVALGVSHQVVFNRGSTRIDTQPAFEQDAGLLASGGNRGRATSNRFAAVPEVGFNLKFRLTDNIQFFGGYSFLYWSSILRPGDQVDPVVNVNGVPTSATFGDPGGPNRPLFQFRATDFFAHGANFGVVFSY